jgi:hypothetical protein
MPSERKFYRHKVRESDPGAIQPILLQCFPSLLQSNLESGLRRVLVNETTSLKLMPSVLDSRIVWQ